VLLLVEMEEALVELALLFARIGERPPLTLESVSLPESVVWEG
jgi:hypothetical protein